MLDIIKSGTEITRIFKSGKRLNTKYLTLIVCEDEKRHGQTGRVAFIAGKKNGNAVWRNRAKRRLRALCRDVGGPLPGYDVIFLAKRSTTTATYSKVLAACESTYSGLRNEGKK